MLGTALGFGKQWQKRGVRVAWKSKKCGLLQQPLGAENKLASGVFAQQMVRLWNCLLDDIWELKFTWAHGETLQILEKGTCLRRVVSGCHWVGITAGSGSPLGRRQKSTGGQIPHMFALSSLFLGCLLVATVKAQAVSLDHWTNPLPCSWLVYLSGASPEVFALFAHRMQAITGSVTRRNTNALTTVQ